MMNARIAIRTTAITTTDNSKLAMPDCFEKKAQIARIRTAEMKITAGPDRNHSDAAKAMIATITDKNFCKVP